MHYDTEVLIVGAGPIGLTMAAFLNHFGVKARIIDKKSERTQTSNAVGVHARTMELLNIIGLSEQFSVSGRHMRSVKFFNKQQSFAEFDFSALSSKYNYICDVPQWQTEEILIQHLETHGITVERDVTLSTLDVEQDGVIASLESARGVQTVRTQWLLACDGYRSTVREAIKIPYQGEDLKYHFMMIDAPVTWSDSLDSMSLGLGSELSMAMFPMNNSVRMIAEVSHSNKYKNLHSADEHVFSEMAEECFPGTMKISKPLWESSFWIHERLAQHYRRGRILLAGDAAHAHSPAGGQGMNTGMQDAINLSWKLAWVIKGYAGEKLLASYEEERRPVAANVIQKSTLATKMGMTHNPFVNFVRNHVLPTLSHLQFVQHKMINTIAELTVNYRESSVVCGKGDGYYAPGDRAPCLTSCEYGYKYCLLDFNGDAGDLEHVKKCTDRLVVVSANNGTIDSSWPSKKGYCLIRPDNYIAYIGSEKADIENYFADLAG